MNAGAMTSTIVNSGTICLRDQSRKTRKIIGTLTTSDTVYIYACLIQSDGSSVRNSFKHTICDPEVLAIMTESLEIVFFEKISE